MKLTEACKHIPVYPDAISRKKIKAEALPAEAPVCEDDGGYISFISEECKKKFIAAKCKFNWLGGRK